MQYCRLTDLWVTFLTRGVTHDERLFLVPFAFIHSLSQTSRKTLGAKPWYFQVITLLNIYGFLKAIAPAQSHETELMIPF